MKKLIASLFAGLLLAGSHVAAQNIPSSYKARGIGVVNYSLNSGGSFYGQVLNSGAGSAWSLGFGSSETTSGTSVLNWNSSGHIFITGIGTPVVSSCGSGATASVVSGSDQAGDLTMGSLTNTCTLTFTAAFTTIPHCFVNDRTSKVPLNAQPTASTLVIVPCSGSIPQNDIVDFFCIGHAA